MTAITEAEAKEKICPIVSEPGHRAFCVASSCMMWRVDKGEPMTRGDEPRPDEVGYCGLVIPVIPPATLPA